MTSMSQVLISILIFAAILTGGLLYVASYVPSTYNSKFSDYNATLDKFEEIRAQNDVVKGTIENAAPKSGLQGLINGLWDSSWGALKLLWSSITTMNTLLSEIGALFGLPVWFTVLLYSILAMSLVFAMISLFFRYSF